MKLPRIWTEETVRAFFRELFTRMPEEAQEAMMKALAEYLKEKVADQPSVEWFKQ
jgi:hypothetical protein